MAGFRHDPLGYVLYNFPWGVKGTELEHLSGPRQWQREELEELGAWLRDGATVHEVFRKAIASGHGSGKSAWLCWIIKWALDTQEDTKVVVTANTATQLATKTWPELAKWHGLSLTKDWFTLTATALYSNDTEHDRTWRADAIPWSEQNTEAFQGLHNAGKRIVVVFEEASGIADKVWEVTEGALTDANTEIVWLAPGNPTQATGAFRECFRKFRHRWKVRHIDSREVEGTNRALFDQWVEDYGEDSDFVKVRVRGMFPSMSMRGLFSEADVDAAMGRPLREEQFNFAPVILTCDPAWMGHNSLVIGKRQGLWYTVLRELPKNDNDVQVASLLAALEDEHGADAVFVDLGYGTGIVSAGRAMGRNWTLVGFGESPNDPSCVNKRAEMYRSGRDWLKSGGSIYPAHPVLRQNLLDIEVKARPDGKLLLESKDDMVKRGVSSPDHADAFVLSFAHPVHPKAKLFPAAIQEEYHPHARFKR